METMKESSLIGNILYNKASHWNNHYIFPTQETWLRWIRQNSGRVISRRTLNRWFANLERHGIIKRIRRVTKDRKGNMKFASTLYALGYAGAIQLVKIGVISFKQMRAYMEISINFHKKFKRSKKWVPPIARPERKSQFLSIREINKQIKFIGGVPEF